MSQHEILFPKPVTLMIEGRKVVITPVRFRDFERFGQAAAKAIAIAAAETTVQLYAQARDSGVLLDVLRSTTTLSRWRIRRLPAAAAVQLMYEVIRVNKDFFEQALVSAANVLAGAQQSSD